MALVKRALTCRPSWILVLDTLYNIFVGPWNLNCIFPVVKTFCVQDKWPQQSLVCGCGACLLLSVEKTGPFRMLYEADMSFLSDPADDALFSNLS